MCIRDSRYSIEWVKEVAAPIDFINGFIEVYGDPLAYKASWESVVQIMDEELSLIHIL